MHIKLTLFGESMLFSQSLIQPSSPFQYIKMQILKQEEWIIVIQIQLNSSQANQLSNKYTYMHNLYIKEI